MQLRIAVMAVRNYMIRKLVYSSEVAESHRIPSLQSGDCESSWSSYYKRVQLSRILAGRIGA